MYVNGTRVSAFGSCARLVIQAQVWLQVRTSAEEGLSPGVNMCANSIFPRASPSDETISRVPKHRPVCVANRVAQSLRHPVHKVFGQLDYNINIYLYFYPPPHKVLKCFLLSGLLPPPSLTDCCHIL